MDGGVRRCRYVCERALVGIYRPFPGSDCWPRLEVFAVHRDDLQRHMEKWQASVATGEPFEHEVRFRRAADGQYRWFLVRGVPLRDERGEVLKWYGIATDIDDRKSAEHALNVRNNRLQLLLKLTHQITSNLELREVLRATSAYIREAVHADAAGIAFFDEAACQETARRDRTRAHRSERARGRN